MAAKEKVQLPPYTTYGSFVNLINNLRQHGTPDHITNSVLMGSNSGKAMMRQSLKSLNLIDENEAPTEKFKQLVDSEEQYPLILRDLLTETYSFLFDGSIDISSTTTEKVAEKFKAAGASGSTISKCMAFFLRAAKEADINVSSRVKAPTVDRGRRRRNSPPSRNPELDEVQINNDPNGDEMPLVHEGMERITIPLRGMDDGVIYFPQEMDTDDAKRAIRMTKFILEEYYGIDGN